MPEGDTIYKVARFMDAELAGQKLVAVRIARMAMPELRGRTVLSVRSVGKHMLIALAPEQEGWILRSHLGLHGTWHSYAPTEAWQRPAWQASLVIATERRVFVCFNALNAECIRPHSVSQTALGHLGPDLCASQCDMDEVVRRASGQPPEAPMVDVLLSQQVSAGIGNVYKCELLFMFKLHPLTACSAVDAAHLREIYETARQLLLQNLGGWRRTTTYDPRHGERAQARLYVYKRKDSPCFTCGALIVRADLGRTSRSTYWCPSCQNQRLSSSLNVNARP